MTFSRNIRIIAIDRMNLKMDKKVIVCQINW